MPVITMRVPCVVKSRTGNNGFGEAVYSAPRQAKCAVLKLEKARQHSTVRADSSGTRGHAEEYIAEGRLLMKKNDPIKVDDYIEVNGLTLRVLSVRPRYNVFSKIDHLEIEATIE